MVTLFAFIVYPFWCERKGYSGNGTATNTALWDEKSLI